MKKILIFSTDDHLYPAGGAEQAFGNITRRLPHVEFDLICARLRKGVAKKEKMKNVTIHRLGFGIARIDGIILALFGHLYAYKLMKKNEYSLLWAIMASYGAFSAMRVKKKSGLPFLLTLQEGDSFEYIYDKVKFVRGSFNNIFVSADGIHAISHYLLNWGREMGYAGQHGKVIPNGVDVGAFTKEFSTDDVLNKRKDFGFAEGATLLFTSSRLEKKNGVGDVIESLAKLDENVCFVICGSGSLDGSLKEKVSNFGLEKRVKFMGFVDPSELPLLMKASDIFIRPSLSEGLGNAFLEAMTSQMITIGTNARGIPDFLTDGQTGFIVGIENSESITDTIQKIMKLSDQEKEEINNRAQALVIEKYNWDVVTKDMEKLFKELINT